MLAGGVAGNLQAASEGESRLGIDRLIQRKLMCIADDWMEETGTHTSIHFDYSRDPWSIADRSLWRRAVDVISKASSDPTQLGTAFGDEALVNVFLVYLYQKLDLFFQFDQLGPTKRDFALPFGCPPLRPVESC